MEIVVEQGPFLVVPNEAIIEEGDRHIVYVYRFQWYSPVSGGRLRAMHCMDIPFAFDNVDNIRAIVGNGPAGRRSPTA